MFNVRTSTDLILVDIFLEETSNDLGVCDLVMNVVRITYSSQNESENLTKNLGVSGESKTVK